MDYKERYEKALGRARSMYESKDDAELAAFIFPELAESEDERIRKVIIEHFKQSETEFPGLTFGGYYYSDVLAYLEKQKENPKSADSIPSDCVSDAKCEDKSPKHSDSYGTDIHDTPAYWKGWDDAMKQKEQKPAWSEEEEQMFDNILNHYSLIEAPTDGNGISKERYLAFLKSLRPQPKQELP